MHYITPHKFSQLPLNNKKPRLLLTLVLVFLSDVHFHGEAACEEVVGVRLPFVWWRRGESPGAAAGLAPDGSAPDTVCQDLPHRSSLKTVRRTVFLMLRPSRVRLPKLNGNTKRPPSGGLLHLVEARGVEPLSEKPSSQLSTSVFAYLISLLRT